MERVCITFDGSQELHFKDVSKEVKIPLPALYQYEGGGRMPNLERFIILLRYYMCSEKLLVRLIYNGACK